MSAIYIKVTYDDGMCGEFRKQSDGSWIQQIDGGIRVTGYDAPNVMRVLSTAVGTKEIAE